MLCSVVKHAGSGRARKKFREKYESQSRVFPHAFLEYTTLLVSALQIFITTFALRALYAYLESLYNAVYNAYHMRRSTKAYTKEWKLTETV